ncbi:MAG: chemotaxis protein CheA [Bdellovibrionia bacterium]
MIENGSASTWKISLEELKKTLSADPYHMVYLGDSLEDRKTFEGTLLTLGVHPFLCADPQEGLKWIQLHQSMILGVVIDWAWLIGKGWNLNQKDALDFRAQMGAQLPLAICAERGPAELQSYGVDLEKKFVFLHPLTEPQILEFIKKGVIDRLLSIKEDREILKAVIEESLSNLEQAEDLALRLEQDPEDMEAINLCFGIVHTIKGASSFFEPKTLNRFAHKFEEILKKAQRKEIELNGRTVSIILKGLDQLKELLLEMRTGSFKQQDVESLIAEVFESDVQSEKPSLEGKSLEPKKKFDQPQAQSAAPVAEPADGGAKKDQTKGPSELKVAVSLLDEFMQISGEMTVIRNMLNKCVRAIEKQYAGDKDVVMLVELLEELHHVNSSVQSKITEIRKVSVKNILRPLNRAIRDTTKLLGKEAELLIEGQELRVDTAIAEVLSNSLIHIIRNSIDHGIEKPEDRVQVGKNRAGKITITAKTQSDLVIVEIEDDGRGISEEAIKNRLIKNGSHTREEAERLLPDELYGMIFESGFSTAEKVTDISGRGVGMSMVKSQVQSLGGKIKIFSKKGLGSKFVLTLPVLKSVLITNCLFVEAGGFEFGLPQDDILRVLKVTDSNRSDLLFPLQGSLTLIFEDQLVPIIHLAKLLGLVQTDLAVDEEMNLIVVQVGSRTAALVVDVVMNVEDTVIKALQGRLKSLDLYQGATFLDDGTVGLILDPQGLLNHAAVKGAVQKSASERRLKPVQDLEKNHQSLSSVLLFELFQRGNYAISQPSVFRIEEIELAQVRSSAGERVMAYRGQILTLIDLEAFLFQSQPDFNRYGEKLSTIIFSHGKNFYGFVVRKIMDIRQVTHPPIVPLKKEFGILGNYISKEETICALDLEEILQRLTSSGPAYAAPSTPRFKQVG